MKNIAQGLIKSSVISFIFGIVSGFLATVAFGGNLYYNLIAALTLIFISQADPKIFKKLSSTQSKRWIYSTIAVLSFIPICLNVNFWALLALPFPFMFSFFGVPTGIRQYYRKLREVEKCTHCKKIKYSHPSFFRRTDTVSDPAFKSLVGNIYHKR